MFSSRENNQLSRENKNRHPLSHNSSVQTKKNPTSKPTPTAKNKQTESSKIQFQHVNHYSLSTLNPQIKRDTHHHVTFPQSPTTRATEVPVPPRLRSISYKAIFKSTMVQTSGPRFDDVQVGWVDVWEGEFFPPNLQQMAPRGYGNGKSRLAIKIKQWQNVW